jgi:hypothetical protein
LEEFLKTKLVIPDPPQIMGAIGAALLAGFNVGTSDFEHDEKPCEDLQASAYI